MSDGVDKRTIEQIIKELLELPDEEFLKRVKEYENGEIALLLKYANWEVSDESEN